MRVDVLIETFGARWDEVVGAAQAAERAGLDGVWLNDHLAGGVHRAPHVLECWTTLAALASVVPRVTLGPLVLNVANRDPGVVAVMAATLQQVSGGRLILGLGAGGGPHTPYAAEQLALGLPVPGDAARRDNVAQAVTTIRQVWSGSVGAASGFLRPEPPPPVLVAGFGLKMAALAGRIADMLGAPIGPSLPTLVAAARDARAQAGGDPDTLTVVGTLGGVPHDLETLAGHDLDRVVVAIAPPFERSIGQLRQLVKD